MKTNYAFVNMRFVPSEDAKLPVNDLSINRAYGIFDFFKTIKGCPVFLPDHLDRFLRSAERMYLKTPYSKTDLQEIIYELIHKNNLQNSGIRLLLTGGESADGYSLSTPNFILTQQALEFPAHMPAPIRLTSLNHQRQLPEVKTMDYLMAIYNQFLLREKGTQELLYHQDGKVRECPRANFFIVNREGTLITPKAGVLAGITRSKIVNLAKRRMSVEERELDLEEVYLAREAFISSTTKQVLPVSEIDGIQIGTGDAGVMTRMLYEDLTELINRQIRN